MKKHRFIPVYVLIIIVMVILVSIGKCKDSFMFTFDTYDHIQYNGIDYYQADNQHPPSTTNTEQVSIYLVSKSSKVDYKHVYYAQKYKDYEGEAESIYLFFDSAVYIRGDYMTETTNTTSESTTIA
ncbi:MAG: hypothetical protein FWD71_21860 [Oscillospiraceae bacterium]|nr:hypothetical protein [Oscillospiraceae bacterium]